MNELPNGFHLYGPGEDVFEGYLAWPEGAGLGLPCIVLGPDWSGPNGSIQAIARRLASFGFAVFAVDVYGKGVRGDETGDNAHLMGPLLDDRAVLLERLLAGYETARALPMVDGGRMVAMGYCFGGLCALDLARADPDGLIGTISVHGLLTPPTETPPPAMRSKVLLLHGWEDPFAPPEDVLAIARELTVAGADWQLQAFGHALHAFTFERAAFPERGIVYDEPAARRAWQAVLRHLDEILGR